MTCGNSSVAGCILTYGYVLVTLWHAGVTITESNGKSRIGFSQNNRMELVDQEMSP
jgi:hypothetical protein